MPKINGQGYSEITLKKQEAVKCIMEKHINVIRGLKNKFPAWLDPYYHYFDIYAGSGIHPENGKNGSPLNAMELLLKYHVPSKLVFIEKGKKNFVTLRKKIATISGNGVLPSSDLIQIELRQGDNRNILPEYFVPTTKVRSGLLYSDANGSPNFELISDFSNIACYQKTDILMCVPTTTIKRLRMSTHIHHSRHTKTLCEYLSQINKQFGYVQLPVGGGMGWTLFYYTNGIVNGMVKKLGFHDIKSLKGTKIMHRVNYTKDELKDLYGVDWKSLLNIESKQRSLFNSPKK